MKNQYVGDENDYRKYGLLRLLTDQGQLSCGVCWMLTPDDGGSDGGKISYLGNREARRHRDPTLFDTLTDSVLHRRNRNVSEIERAGILPNARFFVNVLTDNESQRRSYFEAARACFRGVDLIFFDPDNGMEVSSKPRGRPGSAKYLYWLELGMTFRANHSVLVYQHFPRRDRVTLCDETQEEFKKRLGAPEVHLYLTPNVLFVLAVQPRHVDYFRSRAPLVEKAWGSEINPVIPPAR
jgi:hypothetical protein